MGITHPNWGKHADNGLEPHPVAQPHSTQSSCAAQSRRSLPRLYSDDILVGKVPLSWHFGKPPKCRISPNPDFRAKIPGPGLASLARYRFELSLHSPAIVLFQQDLPQPNLRRRYLDILVILDVLEGVFQ